jgi:hypothetical protein
VLEHLALARGEARELLLVGAAQLGLVQAPGLEREAVSMAPRSCASSNGFSTKSTARPRNAARAAGTSPCAVMITNGSALPRSRTRACSSRPLMPGRRRSATTQPDQDASKAARKLSASANRRVE